MARYIHTFLLEKEKIVNVTSLESVVHWIGGLAACATLVILLAGIWLGTRRPAGRVTGRAPGWLSSPLFYLFSTTLFLGFSVALWRQLPLLLSMKARVLMLALGVIVYFPGLVFLLWGRLTLGKMYFVSTAFGAQLFAGHQLVTRGPFALVRHPMYLGLIASAVGSLLLYQTWTTAAFAIFAPFILFRAHREEQALAGEFGEEWRAYSRRVPPFFPRLTKRE